MDSLKLAQQINALNDVDRHVVIRLIERLAAQDAGGQFDNVEQV